MEMTIKRVAGILCFIIGILTAFFFVQAYMEGKFDSAATLREYIAGFGMLGPFILGALQAFQVVIPILPGFIGCAAGAILFGCMGGFWCNYIGISAGSIVSFWLARRFGLELVRQMIPEKKYQVWTKWVNEKKSYTVVLFLAILLPLAPDDILCYLSGLTGMPAKRFTWIILLGKPWCILAYSLFFSYFI